MTLDLRPMLRGETNRIAISYDLTPEPMPGVAFGNAEIRGEVVDSAGYIRLTLSASVTYRAECARCLAPVEGQFAMDFERTVADRKTLSAEAIEEDDGEYALMEDGRLSVDDQILEEMVLRFPTKILCSETCEGLCPKCGKPRREGACGCATKEMDPRLAVLKEYSFPDAEQDDDDAEKGDG